MEIPTWLERTRDWINAKEKGKHLKFRYLPYERRKRDSNPRYLSVRQFSRLLQSTALPFLLWNLVQSLNFGPEQHVYREASANINAFMKKGNPSAVFIFSERILVQINSIFQYLNQGKAGKQSSILIYPPFDGFNGDSSCFQQAQHTVLAPKVSSSNCTKNGIGLDHFQQTLGHK